MTRLTGIDYQTNTEEPLPVRSLVPLDGGPTQDAVAFSQSSRGQTYQERVQDTVRTSAAEPTRTMAGSDTVFDFAAGRMLPAWAQGIGAGAMRIGRQLAVPALDSIRRFGASAGQAVSDAVSGVSSGLVDLEGTTPIADDRARYLQSIGDPMGDYLAAQSRFVNDVGNEAFRQSMASQRRPTEGLPNDAWSFVGSTAGSMAPAAVGMAGGPVGTALATGVYAADGYYQVQDAAIDAFMRDGGQYDPEAVKSLAATGALIEGALNFVPIPVVKQAGEKAVERMIEGAIKNAPGWRKTVAKEFATALGTGAVAEGGTEAVQELAGAALQLAYDSEARRQWSDDPRGAAAALAQRIGMAAAGGALGGTMLGGAGLGLAAANARQAGAPATTDAAQPDRSMQAAIDAGTVVENTPLQSPIAPSPAQPVRPQYAPGKAAPPATNYVEPLSRYTDTVYRESDIDSALMMVRAYGREADMSGDRVYLANTPDLAIGQKNNRGVLMEFDAAPLRGQIDQSKPTWAASWDGGNAEFVGQNGQGAYRDALRAITVKKGALGSKPYKARLNLATKALESAGWSRTDNADGSTTWRRPQAAEPATKAARSPRPKLQASLLYDAAFQQKYAEVPEDGAPRKVTPAEAVKSLRRAGLWPESRTPDDFALEVIGTPGYERVGAWLMETPTLSREMAQAIFGKNAPRSKGERNAFLKTFRETVRDLRPGGFDASKFVDRGVPVVPPMRGKDAAEVAGMPPEDLNVPFREGWRADASERILDQFSRLEKYEKDIAKKVGKSVPADASPVQALRRADAMVTHLAKGYQERLTRVYEEASDAGISPDIINLAGIAQHSPEANDAVARRTTDPNVIGGMTNAQAAQTLATLQARHDWPAIEKAVNEIRAVLEDSIELANDAGVYTDEVYNRIKNYRQFWPIRDNPDWNEEAVPTGAPSRFTVRSSGLRERFGRAIGSIDDGERLAGILDAGLSHIQLMVNERVRRAVHNEVGNALVTLARDYRSESALQIVNEKPTVKRRGEDGQTATVADRAFPDREDIYTARAAEPFTHDGTAYEKGDPVYVKIGNRELAKVLNQATVTQEESIVFRAMAAPFRAFAQSVRFTSTAGNPIFWLRQVPLDMQDAMATAFIEAGMTRREAMGAIKRTMFRAPSAFVAISAAEIMRGGKTVDPASLPPGAKPMAKRWAEYNKLGGRMGVMRPIDFDAANDIAKAIFDPTFKTRAKQTLKHVSDVMDRFSTPFESSVRLAYFDTLVESGVDPRVAVVKARDLQVDFGKRGSSQKLRLYGSMTAFLNARIQGSVKQWRLLTSRRGAEIMAATALLSFGLATARILAGRDDEDKNENGVPDSEEIGDWKRRSTWQIPIPWTDVNFSPRVGWMLLPAKLLGEELARLAFGKTTKSDAFTSVAAGFAEAGLPVTTSMDKSLGGNLLSFAPDLARMVGQQVLNEDYAGRRIYTPFRDEGTLRSESGMAETNAWAKSAARAIYELTAGQVDVYPEILQNTAESFGGGWVSMFTQGGRAIQNFRDGQAGALTEMPLVKDFVTSWPNQSWTTEQYYDMRDRAVGFERDLDRLTRIDPTGQRADDFVRDNPQLVNEHAIVFGFGTGKYRQRGMEEWLKKIRQSRRALMESGASGEVADAVVREEMRRLRDEELRLRNAAIRQSR